MADYIFGIAQVKAGLQFLTGNTDGAKQTLHNNMTKGLGIAHLTAAVAKIAGDDDLAKEAWQGGNQALSGAANAIPVVGHVKSVVHLACGDEEGAKRAFLSSTRTAAVMGAGAAGLVAGPVGAFAAGSAVGTTWDVTTAVVTDGKQLPGITRALEEPGKWENWLDAGISVASDGATGLSGYELAKSAKKQGPQRGEPSKQPTAKQQQQAAEKGAKAAQDLVDDLTNDRISYQEYEKKWQEVQKEYPAPARPSEQWMKAEEAYKNGHISERQYREFLAKEPQSHPKPTNIPTAESERYFPTADARTLPSRNSKRTRQQDNQESYREQHSHQQQKQDNQDEQQEKSESESESDDQDEDEDEDESTEDGREALELLKELIKKLKNTLKKRPRYGNDLLCAIVR